MGKIFRLLVFSGWFLAMNLQGQMLLARFECNGNTAGDGNLSGNNYAAGQMTLSGLHVSGSAASLSYTDASVRLTLTSSVGASNCLYFSMAPVEGYIVEIRRIVMNIRKDSKAGNVILYYNTSGQPFLNSNSTAIYTAGNGNTGTEYTAVPVKYPDHFTSPLKITDPLEPGSILLSSGKDGGALSVDYLAVYGYVYKVGDTPPSDGIEKGFSVDIHENVRSINPLFWGANFLFWIEDDAALADEKIENSLKEMPCTILRYPGGTVADNFHWKTNLLDNVNRFPYEEGAAESDFDEFMAFCSRTGTEPILVVNTESWWIHGDIDGGVQEAVDWVRYCKEKGYQVRYWEIGNETYWHPFMTAQEYGQVVKKYAMAMKTEDPDAKISANGHWDVDVTGTKERTDASRWESIRQMYADISSRQDAEAADAYADQYKDEDIRNGSDKWWDHVAETCGGYIDMISVHWYFSGGTNMESMTGSLEKIRTLFRNKYPDREYTMCMTEYNCNNDDHKLAVSGLFDGIGRFLLAGVEIGNFWPLRNTVNGSRTSILNPATKEEAYPYQVLKMYANNLKGNLLGVSSDDMIFPFASYDGQQLTVVVSGRAITSQPVYATMNFPEMDEFELMDAVSYDPPATNVNPIRLVENDLNVNILESGCSFKVMPYQTVMIRFRNKETAADDPGFSPDPEVYVSGQIIRVSYAKDFETEIYNLRGLKIARQLCSGTAEMDVPAPGVYILRMMSDDFGVKVKKVIVN